MGTGDLDPTVLAGASFGLTFSGESWTLGSLLALPATAGDDDGDNDDEEEDEAGGLGLDSASCCAAGRRFPLPSSRAELDESTSAPLVSGRFP